MVVTSVCHCSLMSQALTLHCSESIWPPPFSTGVYRNKEPPPKGQRDKEIPLSQFISSLLEGVWQHLPGDFGGLLMCRPGSSQLGTHVAIRCRRGFLGVDRVICKKKIIICFSMPTHSSNQGFGPCPRLFFFGSFYTWSRLARNLFGSGGVSS